MKKIVLIPIDDRPICYTLPLDIAKINGNISLKVPPRELLGNLHKTADTEKILKWLEETEEIDYLIISLDTVSYGGLISSRRSASDFEKIRKNVDSLASIILKKHCKTYAFSSIMRISNNNINEEEKEYWNIWGKKIFEYSYFLHKNKAHPQNDIPKEILEDYLKTRKRNFDINLYYLKLIKKGIFDFLIFSKDDTGTFGFNVQEAEYLSSEIKKHKINATVKTGADEIPLALISRAMTEGFEINIVPKFLNQNTNLVSKYEDISIKECVEGQLEIAGVDKKSDNSLDMIINNFEKEQGDLVLGEIVNNFKGKFQTSNHPYFIADVNNANGADNSFIKKLFQNKADKNFFGYCGYNTSANTIGCAIAVAVARMTAGDKYSEENFKKLQFIRFMDDWAYQANIRKNNGDFKPFEDKVNIFLQTNFKNVQYLKPWKRSFEIEVILE